MVDQLLMPSLEIDQELRVRVMGINSEHLSADVGPEIFAPVWGTLEQKMRRVQPFILEFLLLFFTILEHLFHKLGRSQCAAFGFRVLIATEN